MKKWSILRKKPAFSPLLSSKTKMSFVHKIIVPLILRPSPKLSPPGILEIISLRRLNLKLYWFEILKMSYSKRLQPSTSLYTLCNYISCIPKKLISLTKDLEKKKKSNICKIRVASKFRDLDYWFHHFYYCLFFGCNLQRAELGYLL